MGGAIFCTTQQLHYPLADVAVLYQRQEVDSSYFIIKRGFLWGIYKKRGLGLLGA